MPFNVLNFYKILFFTVALLDPQWQGLHSFSLDYESLRQGWNPKMPFFVMTKPLTEKGNIKEFYHLP